MFALLVDRPWLLSATTFVLLWAASLAGVYLRKGRPEMTTAAHSDLDLVRNVTLTLLAVIVGFCLSMAVSRYDLRKTLEEGEANASGAEYARLDLMSAESAMAVRDLLKEYTHERIVHYSSRVPSELQRAELDNPQLQAKSWTATPQAGNRQSTPIMALAVSGMNDDFNSQGYTLAAWRNRLPVEVWELMFIVALAANFLVGFGSYRTSASPLWFFLLTAAMAFLLIAEILQFEKAAAPLDKRSAAARTAEGMNVGRRSQPSCDASA